MGGSLILKLLMLIILYMYSRFLPPYVIYILKIFILSYLLFLTEFPIIKLYKHYFFMKELNEIKFIKKNHILYLNKDHINKLINVINNL
jgi:hypothetical protein